MEKQHREDYQGRTAEGGGAPLLRLPISKNHNERLPRAPQEFNRDGAAEGSWGSFLLTGERRRRIEPVATLWRNGPNLHELAAEKCDCPKNNP
jgi:hypothetical protein